MTVNVQVFTVKIENKKESRFKWGSDDIQEMLNEAMGPQSRCTMVSEEFGKHEPVSSDNVSTQGKNGGASSLSVGRRHKQRSAADL